MKKYVLIIFLFSFFSCHKETIDKTKTVLTIEKESNIALQKWINKSYTNPYNISVSYKWQNVSTYDESILYPPQQDKVKQVLEATKKLWLDLFKEKLTEDFIYDFLPLEIKLYGGANIEDGYESLNVGSSPLTMSLFRVDSYQKDQEHVYRLMRNIFNNYVKLLIWKKPFDRLAFQKYNRFPYSQNHQRGEDIYEKNVFDTGFYSLPASWVGVDEDFAETVSMILTHSTSEIDDMINEASTIPIGASYREIQERTETRRVLEWKRDFVIKYFKDQYNLDLYKLSYTSVIRMQNYLKID